MHPFCAVKIAPAIIASRKIPFDRPEIPGEACMVMDGSWRARVVDETVV